MLVLPHRCAPLDPAADEAGAPLPPHLAPSLASRLTPRLTPCPIRPPPPQHLSPHNGPPPIRPFYAKMTRDHRASTPLPPPAARCCSSASASATSVGSYAATYLIVLSVLCSDRIDVAGQGLRCAPPASLSEQPLRSCGEPPRAHPTPPAPPSPLPSCAPHALRRPRPLPPPLPPSDAALRHVAFLGTSRPSCSCPPLPRSPSSPSSAAQQSCSPLLRGQRPISPRAFGGEGRPQQPKLPPSGSDAKKPRKAYGEGSQ